MNTSPDDKGIELTLKPMYRGVREGDSFKGRIISLENKNEYDVLEPKSVTALREEIGDVKPRALYEVVFSRNPEGVLSSFFSGKKQDRYLVSPFTAAQLRKYESLGTEVEVRVGDRENSYMHQLEVKPTQEIDRYYSDDRGKSWKNLSKDMTLSGKLARHDADLLVLHDQEGAEIARFRQDILENGSSDRADSMKGLIKTALEESRKFVVGVQDGKLQVDLRDAEIPLKKGAKKKAKKASPQESLPQESLKNTLPIPPTQEISNNENNEEGWSVVAKGRKNAGLIVSRSNVDSRQSTNEQPPSAAESKFVPTKNAWGRIPPQSTPTIDSPLASESGQQETLSSIATQASTPAAPGTPKQSAEIKPLSPTTPTVGSSSPGTFMNSAANVSNSAPGSPFQTASIPGTPLSPSKPSSELALDSDPLRLDQEESASFQSPSKSSSAGMSNQPTSLQLENSSVSLTAPTRASTGLTEEELKQFKISLDAANKLGVVDEAGHDHLWHARQCLDLAYSGDYPELQFAASLAAARKLSLVWKPDRDHVWHTRQVVRMAYAGRDAGKQLDASLVAACKKNYRDEVGDSSEHARRSVSLAYSNIPPHGTDPAKQFAASCAFARFPVLFDGQGRNGLWYAHRIVNMAYPNGDRDWKYEASLIAGRYPKFFDKNTGNSFWHAGEAIRLADEMNDPGKKFSARLSAAKNRWDPKQKQYIQELFLRVKDVPNRQREIPDWMYEFAKKAGMLPGAPTQSPNAALVVRNSTQQPLNPYGRGPLAPIHEESSLQTSDPRARASIGVQEASETVQLSSPDKSVGSRYWQNGIPVDSPPQFSPIATNGTYTGMLHSFSYFPSGKTTVRFDVPAIRTQANAGQGNLPSNSSIYFHYWDEPNQKIGDIWRKFAPYRTMNPSYQELSSPPVRGPEGEFIASVLWDRMDKQGAHRRKVTIHEQNPFVRWTIDPESTYFESQPGSMRDSKLPKRISAPIYRPVGRD